MHVAIPIWNGRVSPVFESARTQIVFEVQDGGQTKRNEVQVMDPAPPARVRCLVDHGVDVLVCGAISRPLTQMCVAMGITVVSWVSGSFEEVVQAFLAGALPDPDYTMPGCCSRPVMGRWESSAATHHGAHRCGRRRSRPQGDPGRPRGTGIGRNR